MTTRDVKSEVSAPCFNSPTPAWQARSETKTKININETEKFLLPGFIMKIALESFSAILSQPKPNRFCFFVFGIFS